jgi:hypothetical protein
MPISRDQYNEMVTRLESNKLRAGNVTAQIPGDAAEREIEELHYPILQWCKDQGAAYIRARSDMMSTIQRGAPDFTIFHQGRVFLIECKSRTGKLKPEQIGWAMMAERNKFQVHVVRSMAEFMEIVKI